MFNKDRWDEILEALNANRLRTLLTAFGVFWGILILVLLLALTNGLKTGVSTGFNDFATNSMFMWSQGTSKPYKGLPKGRFFSFKLEDVQVLKDQVPELKYVSPRNQLGGFRGSNNVTRNEKTGAYNVYGDYPEFIKQQPMDITAGRFISYSDIEDKRKVAVIGVDVVKGLYDIGEEPIGTYIKINGINFLVVGTFKNPKSDSDQEEEANTIFVPFTTFSQAFNRADNVGWMAITAHDHTVITDVKEKVFSIMREQRTIHPDDKRAIGHFDLSEEFGQVQGLFLILSFVSYFVGALILMSGVIGISNIMLIVVKERTKEIGIRRAIGATPISIVGQIMLEAITLTSLAGYFGLVLGIVLTEFLSSAIGSNGGGMFINPTIDLKIALTALCILIISGAFAGLIPARKAIKIKPIDALRAE